MSNIHCFTSITANYIPKARVLACSVKKLHPEITFHLVLSDLIPQSVNINDEPFDSIITVEELPIVNRKAWIFKHAVVEMCTAVKGIAFQEIIKRYNAEKVIFLDPDIVVLSPLDGIFNKLDSYSVLLTPHLTAPEDSMEAIEDNEICSLRHGIYNLGFLAIKSSPGGLAFVNWWAERCLKFCYDDIPKGLFTDQRWVDLAPAFFDDLHILREPIYNVATWNLSHRKAEGSLTQGITINGQPICFYHFSGFDSGAQAAMLEKYGSSSEVLFQLRQWYVEECEKMGQTKMGKTPCIYASFSNGIKISKSQRLLYRHRLDLQQVYPDPFAVSDQFNTELSYYHWYAVHGRENYQFEDDESAKNLSQQSIVLKERFLRLNEVHNNLAKSQ